MAPLAVMLLLGMSAKCAAQFFQFQQGGGGINLEDLMGGGGFGGFGGGGGGGYEELPQEEEEEEVRTCTTGAPATRRPAERTCHPMTAARVCVRPRSHHRVHHAFLLLRTGGPV